MNHFKGRLAHVSTFSNILYSIELKVWKYLFRQTIGAPTTISVIFELIDKNFK